MCTQSHNLVTNNGTARRRGGKRGHNTISEAVSDISTIFKEDRGFRYKGLKYQSAILKLGFIRT